METAIVYHRNGRKILRANTHAGLVARCTKLVLTQQIQCEYPLFHNNYRIFHIRRYSVL